MNGAYKAMVHDYDLDGDLDLAAISFFPDYSRYPEKSFVYLENTGYMQFKDHSFAESSNGRWMVMDAGDMDADGDIDLALGAFVYFLPEGELPGWASDGYQHHPPLWFWEILFGKHIFFHQTNLVKGKPSAP